MRQTDAANFETVMSLGFLSAHQSFWCSRARWKTDSDTAFIASTISVVHFFLSFGSSIPVIDARSRKPPNCRRAKWCERCNDHSVSDRVLQILVGFKNADVLREAFIETTYFLADDAVRSTSCLTQLESD
jgi:hypothetical protein